MQGSRTVLWVLEKIENRNLDIQTDLLKQSVKAWQKVRPHDTRVIYVDEASREHLEKLSLLKCFDEVNKVTYDDFPLVDSKVFWASAKLRVLSKQRSPILMVDNDFTIKKDFVSQLEDKIYFSHLETTKGVYPSPVDSTVRGLKLRFRLREYAANSSFLQMTDPSFARIYAKTSLQIMEQLSKQGEVNPIYMIFAEQQVLYALLSTYCRNFSFLNQGIFNSVTGEQGLQQDPRGIFTYEEAQQYFSHLGPIKNDRL